MDIVNSFDTLAKTMQALPAEAQLAHLLGAGDASSVITTAADAIVLDFISKGDFVGANGAAAVANQIHEFLNELSSRATASIDKQ